MAVFGTLFLFQNPGCVKLPPISIQKKYESWKNIPFESFALVQLHVIANPVECLFSDDPDCFIPDESHTMTSSGSGIIVRTANNLTQILTAAHVCQAPNYEAIVVKGTPYLYDSISSIEVVDYWGNSHSAIISGIDEKNDLCLLITSEAWGTPVMIASHNPPIGSKVYNVAAPMGIFYPGMVLIFDGYYSGENWMSEVFFTVPAYPGSSGSAVFNENGEIISIIHSATMDFPHIAIGSQLSKIHDLIDERGLIE